MRTPDTGGCGELPSTLRAMNTIASGDTIVQSSEHRARDVIGFARVYVKSS